MNNVFSNELGAGVYTISDAAFLTGINKSKVKYLIDKYWNNKFSKDNFKTIYTRSTSKDTLINFHLLIELYVIKELERLGVSTRRAVKAREAMAKLINNPYPLADRALLTDGRSIWYQFNDTMVTADDTNQIVFENIISNYLRRIDFRNNMAEVLWIDGRNSSVIISPNHQLGSPVIKGSNVKTYSIFSMFESGEPVSELSKFFDLTEREIKDAVAFYKNRNAA